MLITLTDEAQKQAAASAAQVQELFDRFVEEQAHPTTHTSDMSMDLITAPARDEERQLLDARFKELEVERQKFTEAAVRLGREKAALEVRELRLTVKIELMMICAGRATKPVGREAGLASRHDAR